MVDKIDKQLRKLSGKQQKVFKEFIEQIIAGNLNGLDVLKLKGRKDTFRVRQGGYRIIFQKLKSGDIQILAFENRSDKTYKA